MLKSIYDQKNSFYSPLIEQTCFCPIICPFTANSSRLSSVDNTDFIQEPEDTTVPSARATLGQSDGVRKVARRGGSGCHISEFTLSTHSGQLELGKRPFVCCESFNNVKKPRKKKIVQQNVKGKMADA